MGSSLVVVIELGLGRGLCHRTMLKKKNERRRKVLTVVAQYRQERGWGCRHQVTLGLDSGISCSRVVGRGRTWDWPSLHKAGVIAIVVGKS